MTTISTVEGGYELACTDCGIKRKFATEPMTLDAFISQMQEFESRHKMCAAWIEANAKATGFEIGGPDD